LTRAHVLKLGGFLEIRRHPDIVNGNNRAQALARLNALAEFLRSVPPSIFLSFHLFANIGSAVLELHAIRFATHEEVHCVAIDYANIFQI
jgi:hypothetical protein